MTKIFTIPVATYDERIQLIKQLRSELGPMGNNWSFVTSRSNIEISSKSPEISATLTFFILKLGTQIKVRNA